MDVSKDRDLGIDMGMDQNMALNMSIVIVFGGDWGCSMDSVPDCNLGIDLEMGLGMTSGVD